MAAMNAYHNGKGFDEPEKVSVRAGSWQEADAARFGGSDKVEVTGTAQVSELDNIIAECAGSAAMYGSWIEQ